MVSEEEWTNVQPGNPQFGFAGFDGLAQPYVQPQPYAQPQQYAQPQPYAQSVPFTLPQQYVQPQPYAQPQQYAQPQSQAVPVAPVASPYAPPGAGFPQAGAQPSPQQALMRHVIGIAKSLEQLLPSYQMLVSLLSDRGQAIGGVDQVLQRLKEATFAHFATLGAIRRVMCGDTSPEALSSLAAGVNQLHALHSQLRPQFERLLMAVVPDIRQMIAGLAGTIAAADAALAQAVPAVQALVGPQLWEAARSKVEPVVAGIGAE